MGAVVLALLLVLALVIFVIPPILVGPDSELTAAERLEAENNVRSTLFQALAGLAILTGLYVTWQTYKLNQQGQVTERFTRAIDQLGNPTLDIQLGGMYALERIAEESARDHWPIMEILTAFVREQAPWTGVSIGSPSADRRPRTEVQAVLTILGRRKVEHEDVGRRLDLQGTDLRGANLDGGNFERALLASANLERANLFAAKLREAVFTEAHLKGAFLAQADLERANLYKAHFESAHLGGANLNGVQASGAHLENARLMEADLREAFLLGAHLEGTLLKNARLGGANLLQTSGLTPRQVGAARIDESTRLPAPLREELSASENDARK